MFIIQVLPVFMILQEAHWSHNALYFCRKTYFIRKDLSYQKIEKLESWPLVRIEGWPVLLPDTPCYNLWRGTCVSLFQMLNSQLWNYGSCRDKYERKISCTGLSLSIFFENYVFTKQHIKILNEKLLMILLHCKFWGWPEIDRHAHLYNSKYWLQLVQNKTRLLSSE